MITVSITQTGKVNPKDGYGIFNEYEKRFSTLEEAKNWLKEEYGTCKRSYMYQDTKNGKTKRAGYVYHFRNSDISHDSKSWLQQDWVSFYKQTRLTV